MKLGKYKHYKGKEYEVIGIASHSETLEPFVIYKSLCDENRIWARPVNEFYKPVFEFGEVINRFEYIEKSETELEYQKQREKIRKPKVVPPSQNR